MVGRGKESRPSKTVFDPGFHTVDFGFQELDNGFFVSGTWIPDSKRPLVSTFPGLYSGFQSPGFRIPQAKTSRIPESGVLYMGREKERRQFLTIFRLHKRTVRSKSSSSIPDGTVETITNWKLIPLTCVIILITKKKRVYIIFLLDNPYLLIRYPCWDECLLKMRKGAKDKKTEIRDAFYEEKNN